MRSHLALFAFGILASFAVAQATKGGSATPETGAHIPSQAAADVVREAAAADIAFLPARSVSTAFDQANLASILQYPADDVVVVRLTGKEVRMALERSVALYPQPNSSFLQLSGLTVEFSAGGAPDSRILNVATNGGSLDENRTYAVAMPGSLGRGGMGYFKIWNKSKIDHAVAGATLESVLKGKRFAASSSRWVARP